MGHGSLFEPWHCVFIFRAIVWLIPCDVVSIRVVMSYSVRTPTMQGPWRIDKNVFRMGDNFDAEMWVVGVTFVWLLIYMIRVVSLMVLSIICVPTLLAVMAMVYYSWYLESKNHPIVVLTSHPSKFKEFQSILSSERLEESMHSHIQTIETNDISQAAAYRAITAYKCMNRRILAEVTWFELDNGHRGTYKSLVERFKGGRRAFAMAYRGRTMVVENAIAYCDNGITATVHTNTMRGKIVECNAQYECGYESFFVPNQFVSVTLNQLTDQERLAIGVRVVPLLAIATQCLGLNSTPGTYELHVTVSATEAGEALVGPDTQRANMDSSELQEVFCAACEEMGVRPLIIYEDGKLEFQTAEYTICPSEQAAIQRSNQTAVKLASKGFIVCRTRAEAMAYNLGVPVTDLEARQPSLAGRYFEMHARLGPVTNIKALKNMLPRHATLSEVKKRDRWFVSARWFSGTNTSKGRDSVMREWKEMLEQIEECDVLIEKQIKPEYCIFESSGCSG